MKKISEIFPLRCFSFVCCRLNFYPSALVLRKQLPCPEKFLVTRLNYRVNWLIAKKTRPYVFGTRKYDLCLCEKLLIARANLASLLNKPDELFRKCCLMNNFTLKCF